MTQQMKIETFTTDGAKLEDYATTRHGWKSAQDAIAHVCAHRDVIRLPNGWEDRGFNHIGVKQRVTFEAV